ncbi:uncharacterized protein ACJ7VT_005606 isoform 2-T2 [Polymixia lowei]
MRRFFRAHRDEDYSQIQYLTAKCNRLAHEKVLERECLLAREKERSLQNDLEVVATRLLRQEQTNMELRIKHDQLFSRFQHQQGLVEFLQQRVSLAEQESSREAVLLGLQLEQVTSDLLCLQTSDVQLEGLVEELHAEAQHREAQTESLQAELHSKTIELEELRNCNTMQAAQLKELHSAHKRKVKQLQQENDGSLRKLQETAEQFEWLCKQQRYWMCCIKRFKDCLTEEKEALVQQVSTLEKKVLQLRKISPSDSPSQSPLCTLQDTHTGCCNSILPSWDVDTKADLQSQVDQWRGLCEGLFTQAGSDVDGYQKPP